MMDKPDDKLAILTCAGELPRHLYNKALQDGKNAHIIAVKGFCDPASMDIASAIFSFGSFARAVAYLKAEKFTHIVMAGHLIRPSLLDIRFELSTLNLIRKHRDVLIGGDDKVLKRIATYFEGEGFTVLGVQDIDLSLLASKGVMSQREPSKAEQDDIQIAKSLSVKLGELDIGQSFIVHQNSVLAVEAREGTDEMIKRVHALRQNKRIKGRGNFGVFVKFMKSGQDPRLDTPVIGLDTLENCIQAKLSGIAVEAGKVIIMQREEVLKQAKRHNIFIYGF